VARDNLRRAFGATGRGPSAWSDEEIERMVRLSFRHFGQTLAEFMAMPHWSSTEIERRVDRWKKQRVISQ